MQPDLSPGIFQIVADKHIADNTDTFHCVVGLCDNLFPVFLRRLLQIDRDDSLVRSIQIRLEVQHMAVVADN